MLVSKVQSARIAALAARGIAKLAAPSATPLKMHVLAKREIIFSLSSTAALCRSM
jgi:hypothetical protein